MNLNSEIIWKYVYSDGTKGEDNVPVIWTMDNADNCSYAEVTSDGQISVGSEAGTSDKGSFTVRAKNGWGRTPCRENKETKFVLKIL